MATDPGLNGPWPGADQGLPFDPLACGRARAEAEAAGDDARLLALRELEIAEAELPPVIDGARRVRLLCADALATTWEAWDLWRGGRLLLRCIRPGWRRDAVMLRRMARALDAPDPPHWSPDGAWPHLRVHAPGPLLIDRLPVEDAPDTRFLARALGAGLLGLAKLHAAGRVHGGPMAAHLAEGPAGMELLWVDAFAPEGGAEGDLRKLGAAVAALDPDGADPIAQLAADWAESPPPSAADGARLLARQLATTLLGARHRVETRARRRHRQDGLARLAELASALAEFAPPKGRFCLRADGNGVLVLVESDGSELRGGAAAELDARFLPVLWRQGGDLDVQASRAVQRAWARRGDGDPARRAELQSALGSTERGAEAVVRWLAGQTRLRALRKVLVGMGG